MSNCEYCDGGQGNYPSKTLWQEKLMSVLETDIVAEMAVYESDVQGGMLLLTVGDGERAIPIHYCPICGRKIRE